MQRSANIYLQLSSINIIFTIKQSNDASGLLHYGAKAKWQSSLIQFL